MFKRNRVPKLKTGCGMSHVVVALLLGMSLQAEAATYDYTAITKNKSAKANGQVQAGSLRWHCSGSTTCRISGPWPAPGLGACRALAKIIGPIASYGHPKKYLPSDQIDQCNKGIASYKKRAPIVGEIVAATSEPIKGTIVAPLAANLPAVQIPLGDRGVSEAELREVADTINWAGSRRYDLVTFQHRGTAQKGTGLKVLSSEKVDGLLLNRDRLAMQRLDWGLYDDRMNNLVLVSFLADEAGHKVPYSLTATSWGENIYTADRDNDGIVDSAFGSTQHDNRLWMMSHGNFKRLMQCMEEAGMPRGGSDMFAAASLCVPCLDPGADPGAAISAEESRCVNRREGETGGGGPLGGLFNSDAMQGMLGTPNCGPAKPSDITSQARVPRSGRDSDRDLDEMLDGELRQEVDDLRRRARAHREIARGSYSAGETHYGDMRRRLAADMEDTAYLIEKVIGSTGGKRVYLSSVADQARVELEVSLSDHRESRSFENFRWLPPVGSDGMLEPGIEDPRCTGNATSVAQGSIWGNQCRNPDGSHIGITECVRRMTDSTYAITGGKCWEEYGPAGGTTTVCEGDRRSRGSGSGSGDDPGGGVSPGGDASDTTDGGRRSTGGAARGTGGRYIDVTPMGAFLIGLCSRGGCPDAPPMDR